MSWIPEDCFPQMSCMKQVRKTNMVTLHWSKGNIQIPGHALHENGLQGQKGVGPLVSSQEQRALFVPRLNRLSTAHFVPPSVYIAFRLFVFLEKRSSDVSAIPWRVHGTFVSWANSSVGTQSCPTPPGGSAGRPDQTRPLYVRVLDSTVLWCFFSGQTTTVSHVLQGPETNCSVLLLGCNNKQPYVKPECRNIINR